LAPLVAIAVAAVGAAAVPAAHATFAGERGPFAFQRLADPNDEGSAQVFTVEARGARPRQLTSSAGGSFAPDYSPDGQQIAFERGFTDGSPSQLYTINADGSDPLAVSTSCADRCLGDAAPAWAPNGDQLVFERAFRPIIDDNASALDLVVANADGTGEQLVHHFLPLEGEGREAHDAQWSPDGQRLAVNLLNITAKPEFGSAIYTLDPDGTDLRRITPRRLNAGNPDWSPNGKRIVFNSSYEAQAAVEIYTVRPDGSELRRLRREPERSYSFEPVWSPNGRRVAFVHGAGRNSPHIWTMRKNGTRLRQVTHGRLPDLRPDWGTPPR